MKIPRLGLRFFTWFLIFSSRYFPNMRRPAYVRRSTSMMSDGSGEVPVEHLGEGQGKTKRVWVSAGHSRAQPFHVYIFM